MGTFSYKMMWLTDILSKITALKSFKILIVGYINFTFVR